MRGPLPVRELHLASRNPINAKGTKWAIHSLSTLLSGSNSRESIWKIWRPRAYG